jgi:hypothetical protein
MKQNRSISKALLLIPLALALTGMECEKAEALFTGLAGGGKSPGQKANPESDFEFEIDKGAVIITGYVGEAVDVVIPATIQELPVRKISGNYYPKNAAVNSIVIPSGVTTIGEYAFSNYTSLKSITFPKGVKKIGANAFSDCISLSSVTIPVGVTTIDYNAFSNCISLTSITIPESVTSIKDEFGTCTNLAAITVDAANPAYSSEDGVLFNKNKTVLIRYPEGKTGTYTIPSGVTTIDSFAFSGCSSLTTVTIPEGVTTIGNYAFAWCRSLTAVTIPNSVKQVGVEIGHDYGCVFAGCSNLVTVNIAPINRTWTSGFEDCPKLSSASRSAIRAAGYRGNF